MARTRWAAVVVLLILVVGACGDEDATTSDADVDAPATGSTTTIGGSTTAVATAPSSTGVVPATEVPESTTTEPAGPAGAASVRWSESGVVVVGEDGREAAIADEPAEVAVVLPSGAVAWQRAADEAGSPRPIIVVEPSGEARPIDPDAGHRIVLHDAAVVGGGEVLLAATSVVQPPGPEDADSRLVLIDLATRAFTDLGMYGGWESAVVQARFARGSLVVLMAGEGQNWVIVADPDGVARTIVDLEPGDADWSIVVEDPGTTVAVVRGEPGSEASGFRLDLATGQRTDDVAVTLADAGVDLVAPTYGDCPNSPLGSSRADVDLDAGTYAARIDRVDPDTSEVTFDVVQWLSGRDAVDDYHEEFPDDPEGPPNDYRIRNDSTELRTAPLTPEATVLVVDLAGDSSADVDPLDIRAWPAYLTDTSVVQGGGSGGPWWLTFRDGEITRVCEQYVP